MPIELHAYNTPNGRKISVALEEMDLSYTVKVVHIGRNEQFAEPFLKISPNNKIPFTMTARPGVKRGFDVKLA